MDLDRSVKISREEVKVWSLAVSRRTRHLPVLGSLDVTLIVRKAQNPIFISAVFCQKYRQSRKGGN